MKNLMMMSALSAVIGFAACSQKLDESKVPDVVKAAFAKQYPGTAAKWEMEDGKYEASFKENSDAMSILYEANGSMTEGEMDIKVADLPATVLAYIKDHYNGKTIKEAAKITKADGSINYEAEVDGKDVIFDANGNFLKEVKD
jgi:hypothetical protein